MKTKREKSLIRALTSFADHVGSDKIRLVSKDGLMLACPVEPRRPIRNKDQKSTSSKPPMESIKQ